MKVIASGRRTGKTTELIKMCAEAEAKGETSYIICHSNREAFKIHEQAKSMQLKIGFPITVDELLIGGLTGSSVKNLYIDNAEYIIGKLIQRTTATVAAIAVNID